MQLEGKSFDSPDETLTFELGKAAVLRLPNGVVGKGWIEPGWRWSTHVKPVVKTEWCEETHAGYMISGRMGIRMADGTEREFGPGDVFFIPPGHDGWVIGDETLVSIDWAGVEDFAQPR